MNRDYVMLGLYLIVIAVGAAMIERSPVLGIMQVMLGAGIFVLRLSLILKRR